MLNGPQPKSKVNPRVRIELNNSKRFLGSLVVAGTLLLLVVPWRPIPPAHGLDPSWKSVIEWGLINRCHFGADLIFSLGPLGFLYTDLYHPDLFAYQVGFWAITAVLLGVFLSRYWARTPLGVSIVLALGLVLAAGYLRDPWLFFIPLAAAIEAIDPARPGRPWLVYSLVCMSIVAGLVKFTVLIAAATLFLVADTVRLARHRDLPRLTPLLAGGSWLLFGMVSGHWDWPLFVSSSLEVAGGYSAAMQSNGPVVEVARCIGIASMVLVVRGFTPSRDQDRGSMITRSGLIVAMTLTAFLLFKAGLVRHDGHVLITAAGLVLLSTLAAWQAFEYRATLTFRMLTLVTVVVAAYNLLSVPKVHSGGPSRVRNFRDLVIDRPKAALDAAVELLLVRGEDALRKERQHALAAVKAQDPLPSLKGTVDIYSWDQADILAHGLDYSPRPVFQSYSAYTPALIQRNAERLAGSGAPDYVLFAIQTIDERLPALEDGKSWPLLWSRYDPIAAPDGHVLLRRRSQSQRPLAWGVPTVTTVGWGDPVTLEAGRPGAPCVWAEVEIRGNLLGRLLSTVFRAPMVAIKLALADGNTVVHRFVPGMGRTGFLGSPYVEALYGFVDACTPDPHPTSRKVERMSFHVTERARPFFDDQITVRARSLHVGGVPEHQPAPAFGWVRRWWAIGDRLIRGGAMECQFPLRWHNGEMFAHAPCEVPMRWQDGRGLDISFGMFAGAWNPGQTNGVRFEVRGRIDGEWKTLASQELRPVAHEADRRGVRFNIALPEGVDDLLLVTDPLGDTSWDWSYWGPIGESDGSQRASEAAR